MANRMTMVQEAIMRSRSQNAAVNTQSIMRNRAVDQEMNAIINRSSGHSDNLRQMDFQGRPMQEQLSLPLADRAPAAASNPNQLDLPFNANARTGAGDQMDLFGGNPAGPMQGGPGMPSPRSGGGTSPVSQAVAQDAAGGGAALDSNTLFNWQSRPTESAFMGALDSTNIRAGAIAGGVGMAASYVTGGDPMQGALMGAAGGFGARGLHRHLGANAGGISKAASGYEGFGSSVTGYMSKNAQSINTLQARHAMLGGAALMGAMGGGTRQKSHKRGFNAHRGNSF